MPRTHRTAFPLLAGLLLLVLSTATARADWAVGVASFKGGDFETAAREFQGVIDTRPDWAPAHLMLGRSLLALRHESHGLAALRKAVDLAPEDLTVRVFLAEAYLDVERPAEAAAALAEDPPAELAAAKTLHYLRLRGTAHAEAGDHGAALDDLGRAAELAPRDAALQHQYGDLQLRHGSLSKAVDALDRAAAADPQSPEKAATLARSLLRLAEASDGENRAAAYRRALAPARSLTGLRADAESWTLYGEAQLGARLYPEALASFAKASALDAALWRPRFYSGRVLIAQERYAEAEEALAGAVERADEQEGRASTWASLGLAREKQKKLETAALAYREAGDAVALARVEHNLGVEREEIAEQKRQAAIAAKDAEAAEIEERIRDLERGGTGEPR